MIVLIFLSYQYSMTNKRVFAYMIIGIFTLVIGLRYDVGNDYVSYKGFFSNPHLFPKMEYGFTYINKFFHYMGFHFSTIFILGALLEILFFVRAFQNFKYVLPWSFFFLFTTLALFNWDNILRQSIAFCIFLYAVRFINERKIIPYALCIVLAGAFHKSAYPLGIFYFVLPLKIKDDKWLQYVIYFASFAAGAFLKDFLFSNIGGIASIAGFGDSADEMEFLKTVEWNNSKNSMGIATFIWMFLDISCIWLYEKMKRIHSDIGFDLYYKLFFIGIVLQNCIGGTYLDRLNMYFLPFRVVIYGFFMYNFNQKKDVIYKVPIIGFCFLTFALCMWAIYNGAAKCSPYEFVDLQFFPSTYNVFE